MSKSEHPKARARFAAHLRTNVLLALSLLGVSLLIGMAGYHWLGPMSWLDAFVNASMLLGGMGPVGELSSEGLKLFAGIYALYCGVVFIATTGLVLAPVTLTRRRDVEWLTRGDAWRLLMMAGGLSSLLDKRYRIGSRKDLSLASTSGA